MIRGPAENFRLELRMLFDRWRDKPEDDRLSRSEFRRGVKREYERVMADHPLPSAAHGESWKSSR